MKKSKNYPNSNFISEDKVLENKAVLGPKTVNLSICKELGFNVPKFVGVTPETCDQVFHDMEARTILSKKIHERLSCATYAVRSSGLSEDSFTSSLAGQFKTVCDVQPSDLESKILDVLNHAHLYLNGSLDNFSLIIQEYIKPDISGVAFTRNPMGTPDMIIEYHGGVGEDLVGGKVRPKRLSRYWNQSQIMFPTALKEFQTFFEKIKSLETHFQWPQDTEWCIQGGSFFLLQSRMLTTLNQLQYEQIHYLDSVLPANEPFYFEKNGITEVAPRATPLTLDILRRIYNQNGPVNQVYKYYGVKYHQTDFLKTIGNELFVDKESEIKTILPSFTFFRKMTNVPSLQIDRSVLTTLMNTLLISAASIRGNKKSILRLHEKVKQSLGKDNLGVSTEESIEIFLENYQSIFEINFLCELALQNLKLSLKNEDVSIATCLQIAPSHFGFLNRNPIQIENPLLVGNSIEISDESKFVSIVLQKQENESFTKWWATISQMKKSVLLKQIGMAVDLNYLRELGRCLCVVNLNRIRSAIFKLAESKGFEDRKNVYFANFDELLDNSFREEVCISRKKVYEKFQVYNLPSKLSCVTSVKKSEPIGVSQGCAEGELISQDDLNAGLLLGSDYILYTEVLSPDLVKYFGNIRGIIARDGGMLSHLAILARENQIPVVACHELPFAQVKGLRVQIDGALGLVTIHR